MNVPLAAEWLLVGHATLAHRFPSIYVTNPGETTVDRFTIDELTWRG